MRESQNFQSLNCPRCGAPLPAGGVSEFITCAYCGTVQQKVDVERYIEQLRADVYGWVKSIVPAASMTVASVDRVARAQIFEQSIRGEVTSRLGPITMQLTKVGSAPLFLPPYTKAFQSTASSANTDSREMLGLAARFQGLSSFAQSDDQASFISEAATTSEALGYLANVMRIYVSPGPRSYRTVSRTSRARLRRWRRTSREAARLLG